MSNRKSKSRKIEAFIPQGTEKRFSALDGHFILESPGPVLKATGGQTTISEGHPWMSRSKHRLADIGGNFYTEKREPILPDNVVKLAPYIDFGGTYNTFISGVPIPGIDYGVSLDAQFPSLIASTGDDMNEYGATAVSRCLPTNPLASSSTALGEVIKDGIPDIPILHSLKNRAKIVLDAGGEFLNVAYGWLPLKKDVIAIAKAAVELDKALEKYESRSGQPHRAHYEFPLVSHDSVVYRSDPVYAASISGKGLTGTPLDTGQRGRIVVRRKDVTSRWFKGSFTYYLPSDYDSRKQIRSNAATARHLLGIELTPETLWNLAPWSWAIDWFTNTGDVLHNVSAFADQQLVMHYGYLMEHSYSEVTISHEGPSGISGVGSVQPLRFRSETKQRVQASPYGFGVSFESLSSFQKAIIVALGISKSH